MGLWKGVRNLAAVVTAWASAFCVGASTFDVDGRLDEPEWQSAQVITTFYTVEPFSLQPPDYATEAKVYVDKLGIHIGLVCFQPANTQRREKSQRDVNIPGDRAQVIIDFDGNGLKAYGFEVGNGDSILDGIWRDETEFSKDWDGVWYGKSSAEHDRWTAEFLIPWDVVPMARVKGEIRPVGLYIARQIAYQGVKAASVPADNDRVRFLSDIPHTPILNYSAASFNAFVSATARADLLNGENTVDPSVDIFWRPDSSNQISVALNPDFGQVESDNLVVNFSPEETFFEEKRPFFTENQSLFNVTGARNLRLVHTRRIGSAPDVGESPIASIDAAAKVTHTGSVWNYGAFAVTEANEGSATGRDFYVARARAKTGALLTGVLGTYVSRPDLDRKALTSSVDFEYRAKRGIEVTGLLTHASVTGLSHEGGDRIDLSDNGGSVKARHQIDQNWEHNLELVRYGNAFNVTDLGFLPRNNIQGLRYENYHYWPSKDPDSTRKNRLLYVSYETMQNTQRVDLWQKVYIDSALFFKNSSRFEIWAEYLAAEYDDRLTRGGELVNVGAGNKFGGYWGGKSRKHFRYHGILERLNHPVDGNGYHAHIHPTFVVNDAWSIELELHYNERKNWLVWQQQNRINSYTRKQFESYINISGQLDERQDLRLKFQWISLAAAAEKGWQVSTTGDLENDDRRVDDFGISDTAMQLRYSYRLGPLSNIYVVYSRGGHWESESEVDPYRTFAHGWRERTGDNLLVKIRWKL